METAKYILTVIAFFFYTIPGNSYGQSCPYDEVNCKGECGKFIDENHDSYCDYSIITTKKDNQLLSVIPNAPAQKQSTTTDEKVSGEKGSRETEFRGRHQHRGYKDDDDENPTTSLPCNQKNAIGTETEKPDPQAKPASQDSTISTTKTTTIADSADKKKKHNSYDLLTILFLCSLLYGNSFLLAKKGIIKRSTHLKIWNSALLASFLISGIFGLILVAGINYDFLKPYFRTLLFWHVETGIAMSAISIFHVLWHGKFFTNMIKNKTMLAS